MTELVLQLEAGLGKERGRIYSLNPSNSCSQH